MLNLTWSTCDSQLTCVLAHVGCSMPSRFPGARSLNRGLDTLRRSSPYPYLTSTTTPITPVLLRSIIPQSRDNSVSGKHMLSTPKLVW
jgi:hypothetical protein